MEKSEKGCIEFDEEQRVYDIVSRNFPGAPRFFVGYDCGLPFISDEVPEQFREPMIFHELYEFEKLKDKPGRCLSALKEELRLPSADRIGEYLQFRRKTFEELVKYLENNEPRSSFIPEVRASLEFLGSFKF